MVHTRETLAPRREKKKKKRAEIPFFKIDLEDKKGVCFWPFCQLRAVILVIPCISMISNSGSGHSHSHLSERVMKDTQKYISKVYTVKTWIFLNRNKHNMYPVLFGS